MKVLIMSDLHFEFHKDGGDSFLKSIKAEPDVAVVAGDLSSFEGLSRAIKKVSERFKKVVYVYGNHEGYGGSIDAVKSKIKKAAPDNFYFLDNESVEIDGRRFIGCCLWFRFDPLNPVYHRHMNDFFEIENGSTQIYEENAKSLKYLENNVETDDIVVTHHLPSEKSVASQYKNSPLNRFFVCEMDQLILDEDPLLWIHGHTHESFDYTIGVTRVVCNPFGYARLEENFKFKELVIEV